MRILLALWALSAGCGTDALNDAPDQAGSDDADPAIATSDDGGTDGATASADFATAPALPDCPCFSGDGTYCGAAVTSYGGAHACGAPGLAQHGGDLFACKSGQWKVATACGTAGCYVAPAGQADGCHVAGATKTIYVVFNPGAVKRDLAGLFQCLLGKSNFNDLARQYPGGYGLAWGGSTTASCAQGDYACAVGALGKAGFTLADHDFVEIVVAGYCGGDNNARVDGVLVGNLRVRGANVGDCAAAPAEEERVAVHEAFEGVGHWENADCCTGEVAPGSCADNGEAFCPDCPCSCGQFQSNGTYGGYTLDCGGGKTYWSQRVPNAASSEFDPNACTPFVVSP
jgi:hypothetical protein